MEKQKNGRVWLVGFGAVLLSVLAVIPTVTASVFIMPVVTALGTSVSAVVLWISISAVGGTIASLVIGNLMKLIPAKLLVMVGGVFTGLLLVAFGTTDNLIIIYCAAFLQGWGLIISGMTIAQIIISKWFIKSRGLMMSLCLVFIMVFAAILNPLIATMIVSVGYQIVALVMGITIAVLVILIGAFIIVDAPEKVGLKPLGYTENSGTPGGGGGEKNARKSSAFVVSDLPLKVILRTAPFWVIMLVQLVGTFAAQGIGSQSSPFFQSIGLDEVQASLAVAVNALVGMVVMLLYGILTDKKGPTFASIIFAIFATAAFLLNFLWIGWTGAIISAVLFTGAAAISALYAPNMLVKTFGVKNSGQLIGYGHVAGNIGSFAAPIVVAAFFDMNNSYTLIFTIVGVALAIVTVLIIWAGSKRTSERLRLLESRQGETNSGAPTNQAL
jgi:MFS family permease